VSSYGLPTPAPSPNPETAEFWSATAEGKLLLKQCASCSTYLWFPKSICPNCRSTETRWVQAAGTGVVYSYTVSRRGEGPYREVAPYVLAYVELDEGPRLITNIVGVDVDSVRIGDRVRVAFDDTGEGNALIRFTPA
jgi:uncharacterized OB-fold protein